MRYLLLLLVTFVSVEAFAQNNQSFAFTVHPKGNPVKCYYNMNLKEMRYAIYPLKEEGDVGTIVQLLYANENYIAIVVNDEITYVEKGSVAVNTRNYDGRTLHLYSKADYNSEVVYKTTLEHTVTIYDICNGWLYVCLDNKHREKVYGWIAPDMQCPNPFTPCP